MDLGACKACVGYACPLHSCPAVRLIAGHGRLMCGLSTAQCLPAPHHLFGMQLRSVPALNARARSASSPSSRGLSATSTAFWSIPFSELTIIRPIGQGVTPHKWCARLCLQQYTDYACWTVKAQRVHWS